MQFSDTTGKDGIIQNIESLCLLGDGGITGNTTLMAKVTGYVNQAYHKVVSAILAVDKNWKWDDSNYTDFPRGVATLVASQQDYALPAATTSGHASTLLQVNKICVLDTNSTPQEVELTRTELPESELNDRYPDAGRPTVYKLVGNSVKMWPSPSASDVTLTAGLVVYFQRSFDEFVVGDNTQEPGFAVTFHDLLQYDASATYLLPINPDQAVKYLTIFEGRIQKMQDEYVNRDESVQNRIIPVRRSSR